MMELPESRGNLTDGIGRQERFIRVERFRHILIDLFQVTDMGIAISFFPGAVPKKGKIPAGIEEHGNGLVPEVVPLDFRSLLFLFFIVNGSEYFE
ncbi:MAG: hypothetical protein A4E33_02318 [Methanoregula sp. PtaB.Bin085]|nr:MAG: hypothetical protein A4E33_02318 [Methanoregula sp. PtaB.Bin085]